MAGEKKYIELYDLEVYQLSREISRLSWDIYSTLNYNLQKIIGNQFITSIDSVGANIAEGYGRFHYLDKVRFYYNSRASLFEGYLHWLDLLLERNLISESEHNRIKLLAESLLMKLNNFIASTLRSKMNPPKKNSSADN